MHTDLSGQDTRINNPHTAMNQTSPIYKDMPKQRYLNPSERQESTIDSQIHILLNERTIPSNKTSVNEMPRVPQTSYQVKERRFDIERTLNQQSETQLKKNKWGIPK